MRLDIDAMPAGPSMPPAQHGSARDIISLPRVITIISSVIYAISIIYACKNYLQPQWEYLGFTLNEPTFADYVIVAFFVSMCATVTPLRIGSASRLVAIALFFIVIAPGMVITALHINSTDGRRFSLMLGILAAYLLLGLSCRHRMSRRKLAYVDPNQTMLVVIAFAWVVAGATIFMAYRDVMSISALDSVYEQRAAGASTGLVMGYLHTYFSTVLSPGLMAFGLTMKRHLWTILGVAGCVMMYAVNAQKTVLMLPIALVMLGMLSRFCLGSKYFTSCIAILFSIVIVGSTLFWDTSVVAGALAIFFTYRTIAVPGLTLTQYHDFFSDNGFTLWSHVKGIDLIVSPPTAFQSDNLWPGLGYILGDRLFGNPDFNMNANPLSGDGLAAAGIPGLVVIGVILGAYLRLLDLVTHRWNPLFVALITLPIAIALTNGHFFTVMLSFGGLFWLIALSIRELSTQKITVAHRKEA